MLLFNTHLLWIDFILLLGFGALCRLIRKESLMIAACLGSAVCIAPLFCFLEGASWGLVAFIRFVLVVFGVALSAPYHAWKLGQLPQDHRFLVGSFASTLGSKVLGAPVPVLATWLATQTGMVWTAALPVMVTAVAAGIAIAMPVAASQEATNR